MSARVHILHFAVTEIYLQTLKQMSKKILGEAQHLIQYASLIDI